MINISIHSDEFANTECSTIMLLHEVTRMLLLENLHDVCEFNL